MKLEVGMYVRTEYGIEKIVKMKDCCTFAGFEKIINTDKNEYRDFIERSKIKKASHSLLGNDKEPCLIEVGDYVNGLQVIEVREHLHNDIEIVLTNGSFNWSFSKNESDYKIKSIVTKEQFEQMQYKVGE